jgi:hypothetical protein
MVLLLTNAGAAVGVPSMIWLRCATEKMVDILQYPPVSDNTAQGNQMTLTLVSMMTLPQMKQEIVLMTLPIHHLCHHSRDLGRDYPQQRT